MGLKCKASALDLEECSPQGKPSNDPNRIALQLTQRLFANRRELNHTLCNFIDFKFKYVLSDPTKTREREKGRNCVGGTWAGRGLLPYTMPGG